MNTNPCRFRWNGDDHTGCPRCGGTDVDPVPIDRLAYAPRTPEYCWDHLYIPEADLVAHWVRRSNDTLRRYSKSEMRHALGMDAVWLTLIVLVGFASYRIVGG